MVLLLTLVEGIIIALLLIIIAELIYFIVEWKKVNGQNLATPPSNAGEAALEKIRLKLKKIQQQGSISDTECRELKKLIEEARSGGIPDLVLAPFKEQLNELCPGN